MYFWQKMKFYGFDLKTEILRGKTRFYDFTKTTHFYTFGGKFNFTVLAGKHVTERSEQPSVRSKKKKSFSIKDLRERTLTFLSYKKKRFKRKKSETHRMVRVCNVNKL